MSDETKTEEETEAPEEPTLDPILARRVVALVEREDGSLLVMNKCSVAGVDCEESTSLPEAHRLASGAVATLMSKMTAAATLDLMMRAQAAEAQQASKLVLPSGAIPRR